MKVKFNNCVFIHSKYFPVLKRVLPFRYLFFCSPKIRQPHPQVFLVNSSITCSGLHCLRSFWRCWFNMTKLLMSLAWISMTNFSPNLVNSSWLRWLICMWFQPVRNREIFWMNNWDVIPWTFSFCVTCMSH